MFAYIDESGNTGHNLFDENQPLFMSAALITKSDFDVHFSSQIKTLSKKAGVKNLHAAEMGIARISHIAEDLARILKDANAKIHICQVKKIDLAVTKLFDAIFDSGENFAMPWHSYNIPQLRLLLLIKFSYLLDEQILRRFWEHFLKKNKKEVNSGLAEVLIEIKSRIHNLPDQRSRELIEEVIDWALKNPEAIYAHSAGKIQKYSHYPNIVIFPELLKGIDKWSKIWNEPVKTIKHDEQDQFKSTLKFWHEILSNASPIPITIFGESDSIIRQVYNSDFHFTHDTNSPGLQVIDLIIWLVKRSTDGSELSSEFLPLGNYLTKNTTWYELSLQNIMHGLKDFFHHLDTVHISDERLTKAKELLELEEEKRQKKMQDYVQNKLLSVSKKHT